MIENFFANHWQDFAGSYVTLWVVATVIHTMPAPVQGERWYGWAYNALQGIVANWGTINASKMSPPPQDPPKG